MSYQDGLFNVPPDGGGGGGGGLNFSTTEQDTGRTWIDAQPIYQKTVSLGNLPVFGVSTVAHGVTGIDKVIRWRAFYWVAAAPDLSVQIPRIGIPSIDVWVDMVVNGTNIVVTVGNGGVGTHPAWATIYYTKD
jgi:hypothetical protein